MKILHITSHLNVGGITRYALSLSQQLMERGHHVKIASAGGHLEGCAEEIGVGQWCVPLKTSQEFSHKTFRSIRQILSRLEREPADILHAHTRVAQVVADQVSRRSKIPYVTTWHGIYKRRLGRRWYPCTGKMCIAISEVVRQHLVRDFQVPPDRTRLIYNGVDAAHYAAPPDPSVLQAYRERWRIPNGTRLVGGVGRLAAGKVKGFDLLLAAASLLKETLPDLRVLIVGDGPRRPFLEDVAERLGILNRVHFVGGMEDIRIPMALMDVFVFSSRWPEAFGLTLIEAMAAGKPVVGIRMGAVPEIIRDGVDGLLVDPEDIGGLAQGIARLLSDREFAERVGRQGQLLVRERFSVERMAIEVEQVYQEVLGRPERGIMASHG